MASSLEFVRYAAEQMGAAGEITYKKMFGEYGIYCNGKIVGLICENQLFIKITEAGRRLCPDYEEVPIKAQNHICWSRISTTENFLQS